MQQPVLSAVATLGPFRASSSSLDAPLWRLIVALSCRRCSVLLVIPEALCSMRAAPVRDFFSRPF